MTNGPDELPQRICGIVLAGGRSSRMGQDKASLVLDGRSLLQRTVDRLAAVADEIVVVRAPDQRRLEVDSERVVRWATDAVEGEGPLFGIVAGLREALAPVCLIVAVDMPFLRPELLELLARRAGTPGGGPKWVVPMEDGRPQPLCSAMARDAVDRIEMRLAQGDRTVMSIADDIDTLRLPPEDWQAADPAGDSFRNVNTPEDFAAAREEIEAR